VRFLFYALLVCALMSGCAKSKMSSTARTATEQLLLSNAIDQSLSRVNFDSFRGLTVFFDDTYLDSIDKPYVVGSVRHRLLQSGATVVADRAEAEIVLEGRSGAVGTDSSEMFYGLPEVVVPGLVTIPELKVATKTRLTGTAKLGFVAYDTRSNDVLGNGGVAIAVSDHNDWSVLGVGPFVTGSLTTELDAAASGDFYNPASGLPNAVAFEVPGRTGQPIRLTEGYEEADP